MKPTTLARNSVSTETVDLISRLIDLIPWTERRKAMGDVTLSLLDGKHRVAESVFGWNRSTVAVGINEFQSGITCINDLYLTRSRLRIFQIAEILDLEAFSLGL